ncbi:MAG: hypothetical protein K8F92_00555 [Hyphomicrobium sp.]|uniref:hypothetical protein n=1 Tax=Hyphomicrobium sp. TaxID=82 RepID=UPI00132AC3AC|nr:hypothetical protein [Hyphomicrobium sp.]KAB2940190.1 MAG: hypothetical protein F9K20_14150 [Hyphomicrobium sp.]MBZ0208135.1 hypothetical protein [Hyphomicrobium sp.]
MIRFLLIGSLAVPLVTTNALDSDNSFPVLAGQTVLLGDEGDTFTVEHITQNEEQIIVLLQPKGEDCTFRFPLSVGRSIRLRTSNASGQPLSCAVTLQPLTDDASARFGVTCDEQPIENKRKCPPQAGLPNAVSSAE